MQHTDDIMEYNEKEQPLNIKEFLFKILSKWYWFAICGFLGLSMAWIYNKFAVSIWQIESTVLVSDGSKAVGVDNLFDNLNLGKTINLDNHIGLLKSYNLNHQAIENLKWQTSWFAKGRFIDYEYYKDEPYKVLKPDETDHLSTRGINPAGISVYVTTLSENRYQIYYKFEKRTVIGEVKLTEIKQEGKTGTPFVTQDFHFTLEKGLVNPELPCLCAAWSVVCNQRESQPYQAM